MKPTKAQEWARKRNTLKRRVMGLKAQLLNMVKDPILTPNEQAHANTAGREIDTLLRYWDAKNPISKMDYLEKGK